MLCWVDRVFIDWTLQSNCFKRIAVQAPTSPTCCSHEANNHWSKLVGRLEEDGGEKSAQSLVGGRGGVEEDGGEDAEGVDAAQLRVEERHLLHAYRWHVARRLEGHVGGELVDHCQALVLGFVDTLEELVIGRLREETVHHDVVHSHSPLLQTLDKALALGGRKGSGDGDDDELRRRFICQQLPQLDRLVPLPLQRCCCILDVVPSLFSRGEALEPKECLGRIDGAIQFSFDANHLL
mmetsp:Transcript_60412/g.124241  ORF Transcript_60412/g.124241 Transcript_60412/m.124241 type:complete len:237 (+) Transcript_60412:546-1256(+)